jgi:UDP-N-acetylmuramoyl-tripeptide--D-alanyl-D-alanine ligase
MDIKNLYEKFIECSQQISTDTRTIIPGSLFFAWKGELFDGNNYINEAFEKGAHYVVCDDPKDAISDNCIVVKNTIETLQGLAHYHRSLFKIPIIAIGGSNGKTTTKELLAGILKQEKDIVASFASLNNHTGVPLTLLRISASTEIVVLEMGANHVGEINELCNVALPTHGVITNIGRDHIGLFGGIEQILQANLELYDFLHTVNGFIFVNKNDSVLVSKTEYLKNVVYYSVGSDNQNDFYSLHSLPLISFKWKDREVHTNLTGEYNLENIMAALTIAKYFNIQDEKIISGISGYKPTNNRSEIVHTKNNNVIIKDFYNANRTSMELALDNFRNIAQNNHHHGSLGIIGDMLELGEYSLAEHQAIVDYAQKLKLENMVLIGSEFARTDRGKYVTYCNVEEAIVALSTQDIRDKCILLKASKGTNLTKLFNAINW